MALTHPSLSRRVGRVVAVATGDAYLLPRHGSSAFASAVGDEKPGIITCGIGERVRTDMTPTRSRHFTADLGALGLAEDTDLPSDPNQLTPMALLTASLIAALFAPERRSS